MNNNNKFYVSFTDMSEEFIETEIEEYKNNGCKVCYTEIEDKDGEHIVKVWLSKEVE